MKDPARIPRIMHKLSTVWSGVPDLRFWQLLCAIKYTIDKEIDWTMYIDDIFYYEDDRLEECLDEYLDKLIEQQTNQDLNDNLTILLQMKKNGEIEDGDLLY